jgi:hypothetical protein
VVFEALPAHWRRGAVVAALIAAATQIGTLAVLREADIPDALRPEEDDLTQDEVSDWHGAPTDGQIVPLLEARGAQTAAAWQSPLVMVPDSPDVLAAQAALKQADAERVVAIRVQATPAVAARVVELARTGAEVIHVGFSSHGLEEAPAAPRHLRDVLRDIHGQLVKAGLRDQVTLIASGGIAAAEHVAKAIICGADLVAIDVPLLLALECRLCGDCERGLPCPVSLETAPQDFAAQRMINLMAAWHQQFIEVLGAMGIREIRRLRGETGRCMFFEDLERETFGRWLGQRKAPTPAAAGTT